jgi:hypothetical protein
MSATTYGKQATIDKAEVAKNEKKRLRFFEEALKKNPITLTFEDKEKQEELMADKGNLELRKQCKEFEKVNAKEMVKK